MADHLTPLILLTGATGYIGGRLLGVLELAGNRIRCLARRPDFLQPRVGDATEVVTGDMLDIDSLRNAMQDVHTAYYLVHSMGSSGDFEEQDRLAAGNFGKAAREAGVQRIIYLGGLGDSGINLSPHLRSRQEVGRILRAAGGLVIELRASIVIGSGSLSFEMLRTLVERLPVMITPRWVAIQAQPIAINDLLRYLFEAITVQVDGNATYEIGGTDRVSYGELMKEYARQRGLKRIMIPVPILTPRLSSLWLGLVTPLYARVGRKLIDSIRHPTVVRVDTALQTFDIRPMSVRATIASALQNEDRSVAETRWYDAISAAGERKDWAGFRFGNRLVDSRAVKVDISTEDLFRSVQRLGGSTGWYYGNWLWRLRGWIDLLIGGVGMRRGRRDPEDIRVGDTVDWWRVVTFEPGRRVRFEAEMKLPGRAWLTFEVSGDQRCATVRQTAIFDPAGVAGLLYWYFTYPIHQFIFAGMLNGIVKASRQPADSG
jgi:uncharacterized protein YbjT (DUF2867 family)